MSLALLALLTLAAVLVLGALRTDLNIGLLALAAAYLIGLGPAGLSAGQVAGLFPSALVLTIVSVSLFFGLADANGTLRYLTQLVLGLVRGGGRTLPLVFFGLAGVLSALGPGNIAAVALLAPVAMLVAVRTGVRPVLMAVMLCTGANAGTFSPVAVTGSLNTALLEGIGLSGDGLPLQVFASVAALQSLSAALAYLVFRGWRPGPRGRDGALCGPAQTVPAPVRPALSPAQRLTLLAFGIFLVLVAGLHVNAGAAAFVLAALLTLLRAADAEEAIRALPWGVIVLIAGVGTLVNLLEETGSLSLTTTLLARAAGEHTLHALLAFVTGLASLGSSSSGVVMPLFVPLIPELVAKVGAGSPVTAVIAVDVGSHMVDVSPISTLGALCLAALPAGINRASVFRTMLAWGLGMAFFGALVAWVFLDLLW